IRHIAEILGTLPGHPSAVDLATWLADRMRSERRAQSGDRSRRLETGRRAVQLLTVHAAKGLEFPVVLLPEAADQLYNAKRPHDPGVVFHRGADRLFDVSAAPSPEVETLFRAEERADTLRKLYVAATRASSRLVLWWAPTSRNLAESGLQLLLSGPGVANTTKPNIANLPPELFTVTTVPDEAPFTREPAPPPRRALTARRFERAVDHAWTRTSYSGLTEGLHGFTAGEDEPELEAGDALAGTTPPSLGEDTVVPGASGAATDSESFPSPLGDMPAGALFGTIVHEALEHLDPQAPDLDGRLVGLCRRFATANPLAGLNPQLLAAGLSRVLRTPLGTLAPGRTLADFGAADRLAELSFEMPLGGLDAAPELPMPGNRTVADLAALFNDPALLPPTDPLQPYGSLLAATPAANKVLSGFLTGSIDVVLRLRDTAKPSTVPTTPTTDGFVILDYKTNRFPTPEGRPLLVTDYTPDAMAQAMMRAHYPLQALLYAVALTRHLAWRMPDADPATLLSGVGYLFVRGMAGPDTPLCGNDPCGVFVWRPTPALVSAASEVLGGGR
ncbi:MAG: exodeoxyribonuclease V subunit beta, partial [Propionibacteriaceae bacterium]|nr:exodeoxyribonuclease V subunit beta [Propionibacteriaceae bacterium]